MRKIQLLVVACVALVGSCSSAPKKEVKQGPSPAGMYKKDQVGEFVQDTHGSSYENEYYIGVGDHLDIVFFFHQDLTTPGLLVRTDGRITDATTVGPTEGPDDGNPTSRSAG